MTADLHIHTTASDGTMTISEVAAYALKKGVTSIAITDHDTVSSFSSKEVSSFKGLEIIPGVELGCRLDGLCIHILGYYVDVRNQHFLSVLEQLNAGREKRMALMIEKLCALGMNIAYSEVEQKCSEVKGRLHLARVMAEKGYVKNEQDAFEKYLCEGSPAYAPRFSLSVREAVELIAMAGGVSVLAHPFVSALNEEIINKIIEMGINGIEVYYPEHSMLQKEFLREKALSKALEITGGSDFHGLRGGIMMQIGAFDYPAEYFNNFKKRGRNNAH